VLESELHEYYDKRVYTAKLYTLCGNVKINSHSNFNRSLFFAFIGFELKNKILNAFVRFRVLHFSWKTIEFIGKLIYLIVINLVQSWNSLNMLCWNLKFTDCSNH